MPVGRLAAVHNLRILRLPSFPNIGKALTALRERNRFFRGPQSQWDSVSHDWLAWV